MFFSSKLTRRNGEEVGAECVEANVEAGRSDFSAGARVGNVVKLIEERVLLRRGDAIRDAHAALRCGRAEIHYDDFVSFI